MAAAAAATTMSPDFVALVLAAGSATRFGTDKLSAPLEGEPLVAHAIRAARAAPVRRVILVAHPSLAIPQPETAAGQPPLEVVRVESHALSTSLRAGVQAAGEVDGLFVFLGDMPRVPHPLAGELARRLGNHFAALPRHAGRPGHPVLFCARALPLLGTLRGDAGAGAILRARKDDIAFVETADPGVHLDIDVPADLDGLPPRR